MRQHDRFVITGILSAGLLSAVAVAQTKPNAVPDAQVEANVLKALAAAPQLANQSITSTTVYGTVTLSGSVTDEASRDMAEKIVSNTAGVQKVVDQMMVSATPSAASNQAQQQNMEQGSNPMLQSDGTYAPAPSQEQAGTPGNSSSTVGSPPAQQPQAAGQYPQTQQGQYPTQYPQGQNPQQQIGQYPSQQGGQYPPQYPQSQGQYPSQQAGQYPPQYRAPYQSPNGPYYGQPQYPPPQRGGDAVIVPAGTLVQVRINQGMDSKHTAPGAVFNGVVLSDVWTGNVIAIPRGSVIQGTVVDAHPAGEFKGKGELKLQLSQVSFGNTTYPLVTDFWWHQGADKTGATVGNTVGLGAMGALIGAVAGGGVGAAVGAGIGGVAGLGVSSASRIGEASIPPEAIVSFHLTQPADVTTVSQAELNRLGAGLPPNAPPRMVRRYPPPPPPYYGPVYYRPY